MWTGPGIFAKSLTAIYVIPLAFPKGRKWWHALPPVSLPVLASILTIDAMGWSISTATTTLVSTIGKLGVQGSMSVWDLLAYLFYLGIPPQIPLIVYKILGLIWVPAIFAFTILAFRKFGFETEYGIVQSMLIVTLVFLIFKARVTEQYSIYLFALGVIDVASWNPQRKRLLVATMATALFYLVLNNYFLVRFLSPVYPNYTEFELSLSQIEPIRFALLVISGTVFTWLNIRYLISILKRKQHYQTVTGKRPPNHSLNIFQQRRNLP